MPKATITFNLPEENERFKDAVDASDLKSILRKIDQYLRNNSKYTDIEHDSDLYQEVRDHLHELLMDYGITLD